MSSDALDKPSGSQRLADLSDVARACRTAFLETSSSTHWRPTTGSHAAIFAATIADPATSSEGICAGFDLVTEVTVTYLEVAAAHMAGIAALFRSGEVMFPPLPLARSVIEYCAHAMWVIGDGTGTANDMLARAYLEEFTSCEFAKLTAGRMGDTSDDAYKLEVQRWKSVRARAIAAFPGTTASDLSTGGGGRSLGGQTLPGPEAGVAWMFGLLEGLADGSVTERQGKGIYAFLSSGSHPSLYQARQLRVPVSHGDHHGSILSVEIEFLERLLGTAVLMYYNALSYVISFYGLTIGPRNKLMDKINEVLPESLI